MDYKLTYMERTTSTLVPIQSSLSLILNDLQVWSNAGRPSTYFMSDLYKDSNCLDAFARGLCEKSSKDVHPQNQKLKKSRQIFTCSQPPVAAFVASFKNFCDDVYECSGGQGSNCGMEPCLSSEEVASKQECQPLLNPADSTINSGMQCLDGIHTVDVNTSEISYPSLTVPKVQSEYKLRACFPSPGRSSIVYAVSQSSLPALKRSKSPRSIQMSPMYKDSDSKSSTTLHTVKSSAWLDDGNLRHYDQTGRPIMIKRHCKDMLINCRNMDDELAREIARSIQRVADRARRGKFMSYAKFDSSFKLSEVFYEDGKSAHARNPKSSFLGSFVSSGSSSAEAGRSFSQNVSESKSISPIMSVTGVSDVCQSALSMESKTLAEYNYDWIVSDLHSCCRTDSFSSLKPDMAGDVSTISKMSRLTLGQAMMTPMNKPLLKPRDSTQLYHGQRDADLWSSSGSTGFGVHRRLQDVASPSCIFQPSVDGQKLPMWHLKCEQPRTNFRLDLVNEFIFKAHNYLRVRDRPSLHRCFFQRPTYRVMDEGVQFPDLTPPCDRSASISKQATEQADIFQPANENGHDQESKAIPSKTNTLSTNICSQDQNHPSTKLKFIVACDKPFKSTSEFQTALSNPTKASSVGVPETGTERVSSLDPSASSNKCQISISDSYTASAAASFQPRKRKFTSKLPPVAEHRFAKCCKRNQKASRYCRSYRAFCDKRKIKIKYENGQYTVLKEKDRTKKQTVWSIITGKAARLFNSVLRRKRRVDR